jgi:hypothetical protein
MISGHSTASRSSGSSGPRDSQSIDLEEMLSQPVWICGLVEVEAYFVHLSRLSFGEDSFSLCHIGQRNRVEVEFERVQQVTCQCWMGLPTPLSQAYHSGAFRCFDKSFEIRLCSSIR